MTGIEMFLTAYDPSDLPGGSIDPLGFERGYLFLADKILPGMTNVANRPRYFGILCAGAHLAEVDGVASPREQHELRREAVMRLERMWALANVLASEEHGPERLPLDGLRGVTYAVRHAATIRERRIYAAPDFRLLSRQGAYGALGIYGTVAEGMRLLDRRTLDLTPDLGEKLAKAFIKETHMPNSLRRAVRQNRRVRLDELTEWGEAAHVSSPATAAERRCMCELLHGEPTRSRMCQALENHPARDEETELQRLRRILHGMNRANGDGDLWEAMRAIVCFEDAYRTVLLGFERLLWLCDQLQRVDVAMLAGDDVLTLVREQMPRVASEFFLALDDGKSEAFLSNLGRLADVRQFLTEVVDSCGVADAFVSTLLRRHADVQHGKFDRGRRKMPWLERSGQHLNRTMTQVGGLKFEATDPEHITPHFYRTDAADALIEAAGGAE